MFNKYSITIDARLNLFCSEKRLEVPLTFLNHMMIYFPSEGEDNISDTSGEELLNPEGTSMTSTAIKKKLDSLAGSTYGLNIDREGESGDQKRRLRLRWWINKLKCRVQWRRVLKYKIDPHGELCSTCTYTICELMELLKKDTPIHLTLCVFSQLQKCTGINYPYMSLVILELSLKGEHLL